VVATLDSVSDDHVLDLDRVEPDPASEGPQALGQQLLRMDMVECSVRAAFAPRRTDHVDEPGVGHRSVLPISATYVFLSRRIPNMTRTFSFRRTQPHTLVPRIPTTQLTS
jgi:hypothetical protein